MSESSADDKISCSFCGQGEDDVAKIISGPSCYICSGCITLSMDVLVADTRQLEAYKARVKNLESEAEEIVGISLDCEGTATTALGAFNDMLSAFQIAITDRAELKAQLADLESSKKPKPMDDAPRDCHILGTVKPEGCDRVYFVMWWSEDNDGWWGHRSDYWTPDGWIPLPGDEAAS